MMTLMPVMTMLEGCSWGLKGTYSRLL